MLAPDPRGTTACPLGHVPRRGEPQGLASVQRWTDGTTGDGRTGLQDVRHAGGRVGGLLCRVRHVPGLERQRRGGGATPAGRRAEGPRRRAGKPAAGPRPRSRWAAGVAAAGAGARPGGGTGRVGEAGRGHPGCHRAGHVRGRREERLDHRRLLHHPRRRPSRVAHGEPWRGEPAPRRAAHGAGDLLDHARGAGGRTAGDGAALRAFGRRRDPRHAAVHRGHGAPVRASGHPGRAAEPDPARGRQRRQLPASPRQPGGELRPQVRPDGQRPRERRTPRLRAARGRRTRRRQARRPPCASPPRRRRPARSCRGSWS